MPVCKKSFSSFSNKLFPLVLAALVAGTPAVSGQSITGIEMPTIGDIESPSMPTIPSPSVGGSFYRPGFDNSKKSGAPSDGSADKASNSKDDSLDNSSLLSNSLQYSVNDLITSLTASDISNLGDMGLLSSLYSLNGNSSVSKNESAQLAAILNEIRALKKEVAEANTGAASVAPVNVSLQKTDVSVPSSKKRSALLRFLVNNYDIRKTCKVVYISKIQADGSFLLTGDRIYESDGSSVSETFYILFKMNDIKNGKRIYSVETNLSQSRFNEYSFLYQLSQKEDLFAEQTGNLVIIHTSDPTWKLDMLLDLVEE